MTKASASAPVAAPRSYDYVRDPAEIYRLSFATIRAEADLAALPAELEALAVRMIHACGDPRIIADLAFSDGAAAAGRAALAQGAPILVDTEMVAAGIIRSRLPAHNRVICTLGEAGVGQDAEALGTTRSAAAIDRWRPHLDGAVVAIGNAPTALFRLLELIDQGAPRPALILGLPVGFVGAAESKEALIAHPAGLPHIALRGRRGGSAFAAAAVNALAGSAANGVQP
ncbi:MAG: precorrin-8X methylmutase [Rhodospirillales bacterium]|nr:precorrin-8X methylmutase [Rhodospirillales bacterium]